MTSTKQGAESNAEIPNLLKKSLALQLFEVNVPQAAIAKKLKMDLNAVNRFLKGIKKSAHKETDKI